MISKPHPYLPLIVSDDGTITGVRGHALKPHTPVRADGRPAYKTIGLRHPERPETVKRYPVHILVCETFHGPRPVGKVAAHRNGDNQDNRAANLRWATHKENSADKARHGTQLRGEQMPLCKLTEVDVLEIRVLAKLPGVTQTAIAERYGISQQLVSEIHRRVSWAYLADPEEEAGTIAA